MTTQNRPPTSKGSGTSNSVAPLYLTLGVIAIGLAAYAALRLGRSISGGSDAVPGNPFEALIAVATGDLRWPVASTVVMAAFVIAGIGMVLVVAVLTRRRRAGREKIDTKASLMDRSSELSGVTGKQARTRAISLRPDLADAPLTDADIGIGVGVTVQGNNTVYMSWEDVFLGFAGPRMGKSASLVMDAVCGAPGASLTTSNKRDVHDRTRGVRESVGTIWRYDLQDIATGPNTADDGFWWNPLKPVTSIVKARKLASYFAAASREDSAKVDAYFDGGAQELLAMTILAAALSGGDLMHVYGWLSSESNELPQQLLRQNKQQVAALRLRSVQGLNPRQRDGLYDMARRFIGLLEEENYARSVLPQTRKDLSLPGFEDTEIGRTVSYPHRYRQFDIDAFVTSTDTLYALSKEGPDSSAALTTALIGSIIDAAQERARRSPGGRLALPLLAVLDEAANVCRLPELPAWYSHLGSQGICVMTLLQSPAQAQRVWGADGVKQLTEAANFLWYGGGLKDKAILSEFSALVGDHDVERWTSSRSGGMFSNGSPSRSQSWSKEAILTVKDLAAMPKTRALLQISGNSPVLIRKRYWSEGPHADAIRDSYLRYGIPGTAVEDHDSGETTTAIMDGEPVALGKDVL